MSIKVSQAFERTSAQPIDASVALTKAQMLAVNDNLMPTYYFTICQDDGKLYLYDKNATASLTTGKFREFSGGGGSSGHTIIDTDGNSMPAEDNLQFTGLDVQDDSTNNTTNVESFGLSADSIDDVVSGTISTNFIPSTFNYSTNEQIVGRWIDGSPIYQKTISTTCPTVTSQYTRAFKYIPVGASVSKFIDVRGVVTHSSGFQWQIPFSTFNSGDTGTVVSSFQMFPHSDTSRPDTIAFQTNAGAMSGAPLVITVQYVKVSS